MSEKVKGILKWFNKVKGYGFVTSNGTDYFVHISQLGQGILDGDGVMFEIEQTSKGFSALGVTRSIGE